MTEKDPKSQRTHEIKKIIRSPFTGSLLEGVSVGCMLTNPEQLALFGLLFAIAGGANLLVAARREGQKNP